MSESDLLNAVLDLAKLRRVRTAHFRPARTARGWRTAVQGDGIGWPDLVLVGQRGPVLYRELKTEKGRVRPEQQQWLDDLAHIGEDVAIWRPVDLRSGRIDAELCRITRAPLGAA